MLISVYPLWLDGANGFEVADEAEDGRWLLWSFVESGNLQLETD